MLLEISKQYLRSLCNEVSPSLQREVLALLGHSDLLIVQSGSSFSELFRAVRLIRGSSIGHLRDWFHEDISFKSGDSFNTIHDLFPEGDLRQPLFVSTYSFFSSSWGEQLDASCFESNQIDGENFPAVPIVLTSHQPGRELNPNSNNLQSSFSGEVPIESKAPPARELIGVFDRAHVLCLDDSGLTEAEIASKTHSVRNKIFSMTPWVWGVHQTNTMWTLPVPTPEEVVCYLDEGSSQRKIFEARGLGMDPPPEPTNSEWAIPDEGWHVLDEAFGTQGLSEAENEVWSGLKRIYDTYNVLASTDMQASSVSDIKPFLVSLQKELPNEVHRMIDSRRRSQFFDTIGKITECLARCLSYRNNFSSITSKNGLPFFDCSSMHKLLLGFARASKSATDSLNLRLRKNISVVFQVGSARSMTSEVLLTTDTTIFLTIHLGANHLYSPQHVLQVLHEVSHHMAFKTFDSASWVEAFGSTIGEAAGNWLTAHLPYIDGEASRIVKEAVRDTTTSVAECVILDPQTDSVESLFLLLKQTINLSGGTGVFRKMIRSRIKWEANRAKNSDAKEVVDFLADESTWSQEFQKRLTSYANETHRLFSEGYADAVTALMLGEKEYANYLSRTLDSHERQAILVTIRQDLLRHAFGESSPVLDSFSECHQDDESDLDMIRPVTPLHCYEGRLLNNAMLVVQLKQFISSERASLEAAGREIFSRDFHETCSRKFLNSHTAAVVLQLWNLDCPSLVTALTQPRDGDLSDENETK